MDECLQLMIDTVVSNGGSMEYADLLAEVPFEQRRYMRQAWVKGKSDNTLRKVIRVVDGKPQHIVYIP
jgi:hypothetical protein